MFAFLKHRYSSRKQKIMEGHHKKKKLEMKDNNTEIELATITLNDEEISDDRRQLIGKDVDVQSKKRRSKNVRVQTKQISSKDVGVQAELTANRLDDEQTNDQQHLSNEDTEGKSDPSHIPRKKNPKKFASERVLFISERFR
jgi:hypothetical protein